MSEDSANKNITRHDPDYFVSEENTADKRKVIEENARSSTVKKISAIIEKEFIKEIETKKQEIEAIYKKLTKATNTMHYLRYAIVNDYYNKAKCPEEIQSSKQYRPHPTVNAPKRKVPYDDMEDEYKCCEELGIVHEKKRLADELAKGKMFKYVIEDPETIVGEEIREFAENDRPGCSKDIVSSQPVINSSGKITKRIVVGNLSVWLDPVIDADSRGKNNATHKWKVYIEDTEKSDLGAIISKVKFFLHPSYKPNDVVEVTSPPFHLARFGWGEFPVRCQLHFKNPINKPVDIIHHLKLDRTCTRLQMLGDQTVIELTLNTRTPTNSPAMLDQVVNLEKDCDNSSIVPDLEFLLKNKLSDKQSNVTILHDLPADHDYVNINSNPSVESQVSQEQECQPESSSHPNKDLTMAKENSNKAPSTKEKSISNQIQSETLNPQNLLKNDSTPANSQPMKYLTKEGITEALVHLINHAKPNSLQNILKILASKTPLITEKASTSHYRTLHPYACESYAVYNSYSKAKQCSMERQRANRVLEILSKSKHEANVSVKDFITWARRYGYTPVDNTLSATKKSKSKKIDDASEKIELSSTIIEEANRWIKDLEDRDDISESDDEVDVLSEKSTTKSVRREPMKKIQQQQEAQHTLLPEILLNFPESKNDMLEYVRNVTSKRGISLHPEELFPETVVTINDKEKTSDVAETIGEKITKKKIIPRVLHLTSSLVINKAVECFVDEILRLSYSCSVDRCEKDQVFIDVDDVRMALLKRDEFEIFTNSGLGTDE